MRCAVFAFIILPPVGCDVTDYKQSLTSSTTCVFITLCGIVSVKLDCLLL